MSAKIGAGKTREEAPSSAGLVDHFIPDAFGFEDELDEFAGCAFPAIGSGGVVGGALLGWRCERRGRVQRAA